jgi:hypothetical protein
MSKTSIKTNPTLWDEIKLEVIRSTKGGPSGKWSARKAQRAVSIYKARGGGYVGQRSESNSLSRWSRQKWGYINDEDKDKDKGNGKGKAMRKKCLRKGSVRKCRKNNSKRKNSRFGRYLPLDVRKQLTPKEKRIENLIKGTRYGEKVPYTKSVLKKLRKVLLQK